MPKKHQYKVSSRSAQTASRRKERRRTAQALVLPSDRPLRMTRRDRRMHRLAEAAAGADYGDGRAGGPALMASSLRQPLGPILAAALASPAADGPTP
jgi:hypothetical protein